MKSFTSYLKSTGKQFGDQTQPRFSVLICCREIIFALPSDKITDCLPDQGDEIVKGKESIALKVYDPTGGLIYNKRVTPTYGNCFPTLYFQGLYFHQLIGNRDSIGLCFHRFAKVKRS